MDLISLLVVLVVLGLVFWLIQSYLPIPAPFKNVILIILVIITCVWLLDWAGILGHVNLGRRG